MEQLIKKYHSYAGPKAAAREYQKDARKLAKEGWSVSSAVVTQYNGLLLHKQGIVLVTYTR
jgi:hypothetical protein